MSQGVRAFFGLVLLSLAVYVGFYIGGQDSQQTPRDIADQQTKVIAVVLPLTGQQSNEAEYIQQGIELALAQLSADQQYQVTYLDSACDEATARLAVDTILREQSVTAIIAGVCDGVASAVAAQGQLFQVPVVVPADRSDNITQFDNVFQLIPSITAELEAVLRTIRQDGQSRVVLLSDASYAADLTTIKSLAATDSIDIVLDDNFSAAIETIADVDPEVVVLVGVDVEVIAGVIQELKDSVAEATLYTMSEVSATELATLAGEDIDGVRQLGLSSGVTGFVQEHTNRYGYAPGKYTPQGYDSMRFIITALTDQDKRTALAALQATQSFVGAAGLITLHNRAISDFFVVREFVDDQLQIREE